MDIVNGYSKLITKPEPVLPTVVFNELKAEWEKELDKLYLNSFYGTFNSDLIPNSYLIASRGNGKTQYLMNSMKSYLEGNMNKTFKFKKIVANGPATIGWINGKKVVIKKSDDDEFDAEKAMLMMAVKSMFGDDEKFHTWFRAQMKLMNEAEEKRFSTKKRKGDDL